MTFRTLKMKSEKKESKAICEFDLLPSADMMCPGNSDDHEFYPKTSATSSLHYPNIKTFYNMYHNLSDFI